MSPRLELPSCKELYIDGKRSVEAWYQGDVWCIQREPTISIQAEALPDSEQYPNGCLRLTGRFEDYAHLYRYFEEVPTISGSAIRGHGILYILHSRLGTRALSVNTGGVARVSFGAIKDNGTWVYNWNENFVKASLYTIRAWYRYQDASGTPRYTYSEQISVRYNDLRDA